MTIAVREREGILAGPTGNRGLFSLVGGVLRVLVVLTMVIFCDLGGDRCFGCAMTLEWGGVMGLWGGVMAGSATVAVTYGWV